MSSTPSRHQQPQPRPWYHVWATSSASPTRHKKHDDPRRCKATRKAGSSSRRRRRRSKKHDLGAFHNLCRTNQISVPQHALEQKFLTDEGDTGQGLQASLDVQHAALGRYPPQLIDGLPVTNLPVHRGQGNPQRRRAPKNSEARPATGTFSYKNIFRRIRGHCYDTTVRYQVLYGKRKKILAYEDVSDPRASESSHTVADNAEKRYFTIISTIHNVTLNKDKIPRATGVSFAASRQAQPSHDEVVEPR